MSYFLDTSVAIHLRDGNPTIYEKLEALRGGVHLSVLTRVELLGGIARSDASRAETRRGRLELILNAFPTAAFDTAAAEKYGEIIASIGYSRRKVIDRMIAAQVLLHDATLVTMNIGDFKDVPGLKVMSW